MQTSKTYNSKFNYDRYLEWVKYSIGWNNEESGGTLMTRLQGLGIIDAELYYINKFDIDKTLDNDISVYSYVNIQSYLWVLGVYELFRMFDQRLRENQETADEEVLMAVNAAKGIFSRIRVPLAKLEPSNKFKNQDYSVPKIGGNDIQIGWSINDNEIIWYRDLSNLALDTFGKIRTHRIRKNINKSS
jgi:hypothetical protein